MSDKQVKTKVKEYIINGDTYFPTVQNERSGTLPAGAYETGVTIEGAPYLNPINIITDEIIDIPDYAINEVVEDIDLFWSDKVTAKFKEYKLTPTRGILVEGAPGCHAAGTEVLMFDGSLKKVEDVVTGDKIMGPDSSVRNVLRPITGRDMMVNINPVKGESFVCNINHILSLKKSGSGKILNITVAAYLKDIKKYTKHKLYRTGVEFNNFQQLEIDPYILGMWLGDGNSRGTCLTTMDKELVAEWKNYAKFVGLQVREEICSSTSDIPNKAANYHITSGRIQKNVFKTNLHKLDLILNKHIPQKYLTSSRSDRLKLLAGLIDTDGYMGCNCYEITSKSSKLANDIVFLTRSLGLAAYKSVKVVNDVDYYRISISGNISEVPTKLSRKIANKRKQVKNVLHTGFSVEMLDVDNYYGFELDGDNLYILKDFTVTHNTGKTIALAKTAKAAIEKYNAVVLFNPDTQNLKQFLRLIKDIEPGRKVLVMFEEFDSILTRDEANLLCLLDGEIKVENVVYLASTNYISRVPSRIKNRPSRFAKIVHFGIPNKEARESFLKAKLHESDMEHLPALLDASDGFVLDQVKDLIISVACFGYPIADSVQKIKHMQKESEGIDDYNEEQAKSIFNSNKKTVKNPLRPLK